MGSTNAKVPPRTTELFADLHLERLNGEKICAWAVSALEAGFDTESVRILAGTSLEALPSFFEARPYFMRALQELQLSVPTSREEALRAYTRSVAEDLVLGRIAVESALDDIHSAVVGPLNHPPDLMGWCYLWEGNAPDGSFAEMSKEELKEAAREFAKTWLASSDKFAA
jgi:hypothetical protein